MSEGILEKRVEALEHELERLRELLESVRPVPGDVASVAVEQLANKLMSSLSDPGKAIAFEKACRQFQEGSKSGLPDPDWLKRMAGMFESESEFDKVIENGRQFRETDHNDKASG